MRYMGIIGCGEHAKHHTLHYGGYFETYGVWDPDPEAMGKFIGKRYGRLEDLLDEPEIVAVMICSPDEFHLTQIEMALAAGKHVFCEKPLLVPGEDIARLEMAFGTANASGRVLTTCHPRRHDRPILWLLEAMRRRRNDVGFLYRFGKVVSFDFDFSYHKPSNEWKYTRSLLLDHLNHEIDLMNALFGIQGFDHYEVAGKRDDGITFRFRGTRRLSASVYPEWCQIRFDQGEVALDMMLGVAYISDHDKKTVEVVGGLAIDYEGRLERVMEDFAKSITYKEHTPYVSRQEMLMNTEAGIVLQGEGIQRIDVRP